MDNIVELTKRELSIVSGGKFGEDGYTEKYWSYLAYISFAALLFFAGCVLYSKCSKTPVALDGGVDGVINGAVAEKIVPPMPSSSWGALEKSEKV